MEEHFLWMLRVAIDEFREAVAAKRVHLSSCTHHEKSPLLTTGIAGSILQGTLGSTSTSVAAA